MTKAMTEPQAPDTEEVVTAAETDEVETEAVETPPTPDESFDLDEAIEAILFAAGHAVT